MSRSRAVPSYRLHKPTGQAVVTIRSADGTRRDVYLGAYNSPDSRAEYGRIVAELATAPAAPLVPSAAARLTVDQVLLAFFRHAEQHYRGADGKPTNEYREFKRALVPVHKLYGHTAAAEFGPRALATAREQLVKAALARKLINQRVGRIKRVFKWAVAQELVPVAVHQALATVVGLQKGRTEAPETEAIKPVDPAHVTATLPRLGAHIRAMVELHGLTGMRPGELCRISLAQIDRSGDVWLYRPEQHKTAHRGQDRVIPLGPKARAVLLAFLCRGSPPPAHFVPPQPGDDTARLVLADASQEAGRDRDAKLLRDLTTRVEFVAGCVVDPEAPLFSPAVAREERFRTARANRKSNVQPSQKSRRKTDPKLVPAAAYTPHTYAHAVRVAARKAGVPHWHPNQLRHTFATAVRKVHGLEAAQVLLGHARADVTQVYAEKNLALATKVAAEVG